MTSEEQAVIDAARQMFAKTFDTTTERVYLGSAVVVANGAALADAIRRLDGYPRPMTSDEQTRAKRVLDGFRRWQASR